MPLLVRMAEKGFSVITECLLENGAAVDVASEVSTIGKTIAQYFWSTVYLP